MAVAAPGVAGTFGAIEMAVVISMVATDMTVGLTAGSVAVGMGPVKAVALGAGGAGGGVPLDGGTLVGVHEIASQRKENAARNLSLLMPSFT